MLSQSAYAKPLCTLTSFNIISAIFSIAQSVQIHEVADEEEEDAFVNSAAAPTFHPLDTVHELGNTFTPMGEYINTRLPNGYEPVIEEGRAVFFLPGILRTFIGDAPQTAVTKWYLSDEYPDGSITTSALDRKKPVFRDADGMQKKKNICQYREMEDRMYDPGTDRFSIRRIVEEENGEVKVTFTDETTETVEAEFTETPEGILKGWAVTRGMSQGSLQRFSGSQFMELDGHKLTSIFHVETEYPNGRPGWAHEINRHINAPEMSPVVPTTFRYEEKVRPNFSSKRLYQLLARPHDCSVTLTEKPEEWFRPPTLHIAIDKTNNRALAESPSKKLLSSGANCQSQTDITKDDEQETPLALTPQDAAPQPLAVRNGITETFENDGRTAVGTLESRFSNGKFHYTESSKRTITTNSEGEAAAMLMNDRIAEGDRQDKCKSWEPAAEASSVPWYTELRPGKVLESSATQTRRMMTYESGLESALFIETVIHSDGLQIWEVRSHGDSPLHSFKLDELVVRTVETHDSLEGRAKGLLTGVYQITGSVKVRDIESTADNLLPTFQSGKWRKFVLQAKSKFDSRSSLPVVEATRDMVTVIGTVGGDMPESSRRHRLGRVLNLFHRARNSNSLETDSEIIVRPSRSSRILQRFGLGRSEAHWSPFPLESNWHRSSSTELYTFSLTTAATPDDEHTRLPLCLLRKVLGQRLEL